MACNETRICEHCNVLLGFAKDDIKRIELLVEYLKKFPR